MNNKQKGSVGIILLIIGIAVILGGGVMYSQKKISKEQIENNVVASSTSITKEFKVTSPKTKTMAVVDDVWEYGELSYFKDGNDMYLLNYFQFENEYSGWTYHIDLETNKVNRIDSQIILKENGKIVAAKPFRVDAEVKYDSNQKFDGYLYNDIQLEQISKETGIAKNDLKLIPRGEISLFNVLVKAEYNPSTNKLILTKEQVSFPVMNMNSWVFEWNGKTYPGNDFIKVGNVHELNGATVTKSGMEFNYNAATDKLSIMY